MLLQLSNVAQFFSLLRKDQPSQQLVYYQTGIGTYTSSGVIGPITSRLSKVSLTRILVVAPLLIDGADSRLDVRMEYRFARQRYVFVFAAIDDRRLTSHEKDGYEFIMQHCA